jgi:uncharacterized protein
MDTREKPEPEQCENELLVKQEQLFTQLRSLESVLIAFSGGADSAYLAWAAHHTLRDRALAITALSPSFSAHDRTQASKFVSESGLRHEFIATDEFDNSAYIANNANRCYFCKKELFDKLQALRTERGFAAIAYGANTDDLADFRPGHRAAFENSVIAPMVEAGLNKSAIRELSRRAGLSTWDRPSSPCLSSRIPYGTRVTIENLSRIERAEAVLREFGFRQFRVRFHGDTAQIEIAQDELPRALQPDLAQSLAENVRKTGFITVNVDPLGYRQGSMNAALLTNPERTTP